MPHILFDEVNEKLDTLMGDATEGEIFNLKTAFGSGYAYTQDPNADKEISDAVHEKLEEAQELVLDQVNGIPTKVVTARQGIENAMP